MFVVVFILFIHVNSDVHQFLCVVLSNHVVYIVKDCVLGETTDFSSKGQSLI